MRHIVYGLGGYDPTKPNNNIVEVYEIDATGPPPLDSVGALATLLAVTEVVAVQDAANAVGLTAGDLVAEAQAWAVFTTGGQ